MYILSEAIKYSKINKLEGDFVECGVWRGGNILLYKYLNDHYLLNKSIFGYDTFEGMTEPEKVDVDYKGHDALQRLNNSIKTFFTERLKPSSIVNLLIDQSTDVPSLLN